MIELRSRSLRSKVARRIFVVFSLCALIPFAGLVIIAYSQVASFFNEKNQRQLREMAKAFGMDIHVRLSLIEAELQVIASRIQESKGSTIAESRGSFSETAQQRIEAVALMTGDNRCNRCLSGLEELPEPTASEKEHLARGKSLVSVVPSTQGKPPVVLMTMVAGLEQTEPNLLVAVINDNFLWGFEEFHELPTHVRPCVVTKSGVALMCRYETPAHVLDAIRQKLTASATGDLEWTDAGKKYFASYWTIPTKFSFHFPGWTVILRTSKEGAFASIEDLTRTFLLGIVASLGFSALLAIHQLRKRLTPVERLQEGTHRIAAKDFDFRVEIRTDDEFEELATSLNSMAGQLGRQFKTLETTGEIGRAVLSHLDTSKVVEIILNRMMNILRSDCATLTLFTQAPESAHKLFLVGAAKETLPAADRHGARKAEPAKEIGLPKGKDALCSLLAETRASRAVSDIDLDSRLKDSDFLRENGFRAFFAVPLLVKDDVIGVLAFFSREQRAFTGDEIGFVEGLTSHTAIAIGNAQLYERTRSQAIQLEKSNRVKDEFLGIVSHELRTPLNVIFGYLNMVRAEMLGELTPEQAKALATVAKQAGELLATVDSILEATKIESGAVLVQTHAVDVPGLVENLKPQYEPVANNEIALNWECPQGLPVLKTDELKLKRILQNLIGNAIKFTKRGHVNISAEYISEPESIEFKIADTGIGIPEDSLPRIFELFHQRDSSTTREFEGVGLGLFIVKELAALIGAKISVESQPDHGSTFTVAVPVMREQSDSSPAGAAEN